jgi:hypothetical protein
VAKKFKSQSSAVRITVTHFWDLEGAILTHFTPKGESINSQVPMFGRMKEALIGIRFSAHEVIGTMKNWLKTRPKTFFFLTELKKKACERLEPLRSC